MTVVSAYLIAQANDDLSLGIFSLYFSIQYFFDVDVPMELHNLQFSNPNVIVACFKVSTNIALLTKRIKIKYIDETPKLHP